MNDPDIGVWEVAARICPDRSLKILWLRCRLFPRSLDRGPIDHDYYRGPTRPH